jgi:hypothetical protein
MLIDIYLFPSQDISKCCELFDAADHHWAVDVIESSNIHSSAQIHFASLDVNAHAVVRIQVHIIEELKSNGR